MSFDYTAVAGSGKVGPVYQINHTSWVAVVTPTDCPKSVRNRCVIDLFCGVVCVVTLPFWHFCWYMGFCHRTESDLFLFLPLLQCMPTVCWNSRKTHANWTRNSASWCHLQSTCFWNQSFSSQNMLLRALIQNICIYGYCFRKRRSSDNTYESVFSVSDDVWVY